jgi:AraC-like DNA-binding protein
MDVVSDVLRGVRLKGAVFFDNVAFGGDWAVVTPLLAEVAHIMPRHEHLIAFHVVTEGSCWIELVDDSVPPIRMNGGDVVVLPRGAEHVMTSKLGVRKQPDYPAFDIPPGRDFPLHSIYNEERGGTVDCHFICGVFGCDSSPFNPLLDSLPGMFAAQTSPANRALLSHLAKAGIEESEKIRSGGDAMLGKVAELIFVEGVRQYIEERAATSHSWLSAVKDRHIGRALQLIHDRPTADWTLEAVSQAIGLSRSVFAERFSLVVGVPFAQYLARWRLQLAARLLETPEASIAQASADVGYESEAAFRRAFKKHVGTSPGAWRKARMAMRHHAGLEELPVG